jgi:hypothetical protein
MREGESEGAEAPLDQGVGEGHPDRPPCSGEIAGTRVVVLGLYTRTDFVAFSPCLQCATLARFLEDAMQKAIDEGQMTCMHDVASILLEYKGILNDCEGNLEVVSACENIARLDLEDLASKGSKLSDIKDDLKDHRMTYGLSGAGSLVSHDWSLKATCNSLAAAFWWVMGKCESIEQKEGGFVGGRLVAKGVRERLYAVFFNVLH